MYKTQIQGTLKEEDEFFSTSRERLLRTTDSQVKSGYRYRVCLLKKRFPKCRHAARWKQAPNGEYVVQVTAVQHEHGTEDEAYRRGLPYHVLSRARMLLQANPFRKVRLSD